MSETTVRSWALAFAEVLAGNQEFERGNVPHYSDARTHLEAVLGYGSLPTGWEWSRASQASPEDKTGPFLDLLQSYADALRPEGYPTRQVLLDLLAEYVSRDEQANQVVNGPPDAARMGELTERANAALGDGGKP